MADWKNDKDLGPWPFLRQRNKWAYLNNPRWRPIPREFYDGGPDDYDGREDEEPQIWTPHHQPKYPSGTIKRHHQCGHWHVPEATESVTTAVPGPLMLIPLEMTQSWLYPDVFDQTYGSTELEIDPADYPGLTQAYFEASIEDPGEIYLVDGSDNVYATLTSTVSPPGVFGAERVRTTFNLNPVKTKYYLKFKAAGEDDWDLRTARVILEGEFSAALIQLELVGGDQSTGGWLGNEEENDANAYAFTSYTTTYGYASGGTLSEWFRLLYIDKSKWDTIDHWMFEVIGAGGDYYAPSDMNSYFALFNKTTGLMIVGSELEFTSRLPVRKTVNLANAVMPDLTDIEVRMKIPGQTGWNAAVAYRICLYAKVDPLTKAEVHWRCGTVAEGGYGIYQEYDDMARYLHQSDKYPAGTPVYFESTAKETGGNGKMYLHDVVGADSGLPESLGVPETATAITGVQPPVGNGDWFNALAAFIQYYEGGNITLNSAYVVQDIALAQAIIEASDFTFSPPLDPSLDLNELKIYVVQASINQASTTSAWAVDPGAIHTLSVPQSNCIGTPPTCTTTALYFTLTSDKAWTVADIEGMIVRVRANQPNNTTETIYSFNLINVLVGYGVDVAQLNFSIVDRERQRTANLAGVMNNGRRYIMHFYTEFGHVVTAHAPSFVIFEVDNS